MVATISRDELKRKIDRGDRFVLAEALPEDVYRKGHLPRAVSLPSDKVKELAPRLIPDKGTEVVVYCGGPT